MEKMTFFERIQRMRKGEKIKCTKCEGGFVSGVGDCETTSLFKCDKCGTSIQMTIR